jgi:hypothetical protein
MKMRLVGAELLYADGQTDVTNVIVALRNFANAPKKQIKRDALRSHYRRSANTHTRARTHTLLSTNHKKPNKNPLRTQSSTF